MENAYIVTQAQMDALARALQNKLENTSVKYTIDTMAEAIERITTKTEYETKDIHLCFQASVKGEPTTVYLYYYAYNSVLEVPEFKQIEREISDTLTEEDISVIKDTYMLIIGEDNISVDQATAINPLCYLWYIDDTITTETTIEWTSASQLIENNGTYVWDHNNNILEVNVPPYEGTDTSLGTIEPNDVVVGKLGYSQDQTVIGTMQEIIDDEFTLTYQHNEDSTAAVITAMINPAERRYIENAPIAHEMRFGLVEGKTITPNLETQIIAREGDIVANGDIVVGSIPAEYIITAGATASAPDIRSGKTAYGNGEQIIGTMPQYTYKDIEGTPGSIYIPAGYYEEINDPVNTEFTWTESRATAMNGSKWRQTFTGILDGYLLSKGAQIDHTSTLSRYQDATEITPSGQSVTTIGASATVEEPLVITESITIKNDSTLVATNIKSGVTINGVTGTYQTPQQFEIADYSLSREGSGPIAQIYLGPRQLIAGDENDGETYSMILYTHATSTQPFPVITKIEGGNAGVDYIFNQNSYLEISTHKRAYPLIVTYGPGMSSDSLYIYYRTDIF